MRRRETKRRFPKQTGGGGKCTSTNLGTYNEFMKPKKINANDCGPMQLKAYVEITSENQSPPSQSDDGAAERRSNGGGQLYVPNGTWGLTIHFTKPVN